MTYAGAKGTTSVPFQFSLLEMLSWMTATAVFFATFKCWPVPYNLARLALWVNVFMLAFIALLILSGMWLVFSKWRLALRIAWGVAIITVVTAPFAVITEGLMSSGVGEIVAALVVVFVLSAFVLWLIASFLVIRWAGYRLEWQWRFGRRRTASAETGDGQA